MMMRHSAWMGVLTVATTVILLVLGIRSAIQIGWLIATGHEASLLTWVPVVAMTIAAVANAMTVGIIGYLRGRR